MGICCVSVAAEASCPAFKMLKSNVGCTDAKASDKPFHHCVPFPGNPSNSFHFSTSWAKWKDLRCLGC